MVSYGSYFFKCSRLCFSYCLQFLTFKCFKLDLDFFVKHSFVLIFITLSNNSHLVRSVLSASRLLVHIIPQGSLENMRKNSILKYTLYHPKKKCIIKIKARVY